MKKILVVFIIASLILNNLLINISFAQNQTTSINLSPYKAVCKFASIEVEEVTPEATETVDYISELENFAGTFGGGGEGGVNILKGIFEGLITDIAVGSISGFLEGLFGKVPVGAAETNNAIATSIKESTKNVLASIRTSIQLAIQDAMTYFKFQLINKVNEIIYGKILKNFIPNLEAYQNFRRFTAYQRAFNKVFSKYKNLPCLPAELKGCFEALLANANQTGINFSKGAENSDKLYRFINTFYNLQKLEILEKRTCESYELEQVYKNLELINPATSSTAFSVFKPPEMYVARLPQEKKPGTLANIFSNLKNIFGAINIKRLTAQLAPGFAPQEISNSFDIYFDIYEPIRTQINISNCLAINDRFLTQVINDLQKEEGQLTAQIQQPGGTTFKPKTQCLKTWAEVEYEETLGALEEAMEKGDMKEIERLDKKREELRNKIEQQKEISGEDPNCLISGPTLSSPSTYEELKKQILTSPLEFFKSQERATNVLVAFVRSWLASKLFKIIDKGFASLEAKSSSNYYYLSDIKKAYDPNRIENICKEMQSTAVPKMYESCKASLGAQSKKILELEKQGVEELQKKVIKVFSKLNQVNLSIQSFIASSTALQNELQNYTQYISTSSNDKLLAIVNNLTVTRDDFRNINQTISGSTSSLDKFLNNETLNQIASVTKEYEAKIQSLDEEIASTSRELENLQREASQKLASAFNLSGAATNKISTFFSDYFDLEKIPYSISITKIRYLTPSGGYHDGEEVNYYNCIPTVGRRTKLSFFSDFYPTHIKDCLYYNDYTVIKNRFELSKVNIRGDGKDLVSGNTILENSTYYSLYFIIHDLIYIFYSLYNVPATKTGIQQESFLYATYNFLTNLMSGNVRVPQNLENEINQIYEYFDALEKYASSTQAYIKEKGNMSDDEFIIAKTGDWNAGLKLRLDESLELLQSTAKGFKEAIEVYRNAIQGNEQFVDQLTKLKLLQQQRDNLIKEMEATTTALWSQVMNLVNPESLQSINNSIDQNLEKINTDIDNLNNLCEEYNNLIDQIEKEINEKLQAPEEQPELPPEETAPGAEIQQPKAIMITQRIFEITKGMFANIFALFNIFKAKKIYIK